MTPNPKPETDFPWWLLIVAVTGLWLFYEVLASEVYSAALAVLAKGIWITILVTLVAYFGACLIGLGLAVACLSRFIVLRQAARLYIEVMRGIPIIVLLLYVAFVVAPGLVAGWNALAVPLGAEELRGRDFPLLWRAVIALMLAYSAFLAEIFRAACRRWTGARWKRPRHSACRAGSGSATSSFPRPSAWCCRPSATTSWRW